MPSSAQGHAWSQIRAQGGAVSGVDGMQSPEVSTCSPARSGAP